MHRRARPCAESGERDSRGNAAGCQAPCRIPAIGSSKPRDAGVTPGSDPVVTVYEQIPPVQTALLQVARQLMLALSVPGGPAPDLQLDDETLAKDDMSS